MTGSAAKAKSGSAYEGRAEVNLETTFRRLKFKNPVTVASGTFGSYDEFCGCVNYEALGAIITKTITVRARPGNPMPRIWETSAGMLNAIGLQNKGLDDFLRHKIPFFARIKTPLIVNIAGESRGDFRTLARALERERSVVKALELNLSCPNVEGGGVSFMKKKRRILDAVKTVRDETNMPLLAKLSPELGDVIDIAGRVLRAGADGLSLINTLKGMAIDVCRREPRLANVTGGLSGPAIKPIALRYVYEVKKHYRTFVVASGGTMSGQDALEFIVAGADLVAVGTANFVNPTAAIDILREIVEFCVRSNIGHIRQLRASLRIPDRFGGTAVPEKKERGRP